MAADYWNYYGTGSTSTSSGGWTDTSGSTTTGGNVYYYPVYECKKYLVEIPEHWDGDEEIQRAFTKLINDDTNTGFTITMWINGDIKITDPDVNLISFKQFVMLLFKNASFLDSKLINNFLMDHASEYTS